MASTHHPQIIAIIGAPIEHSLTPRIQYAALREIGANVVNIACHVAPVNLQKAVTGAQSLGFLGLMVTIPHKEAVLKLCDELHQSARLMGAANFLHFRPDGKIEGHSSDGWAALKSLEEENIAFAGQKIAILGGGGAARSLALTFAAAGAKSIEILNRTHARAQKIAEEVEKLGVSCRAAGMDENSLKNALGEADLLVNATSVGMTPKSDETPVPREFLRPALAVYDIVYNPLETRLLREARANGARAVDGLGMLIYTNVYAVKIGANLEISAATMRGEALRALGGKS